MSRFNTAQLDAQALDLSPAGLRQYNLTHYPVHLRRDIEEIGQDAEALQLVHAHIVPYMYGLKKLFNVPWMDHVCECTAAMTYEHLVLPAVVWQEHRAVLEQAGFKEQADARQFACADGLKEALEAGSNFNKKWV